MGKKGRFFTAGMALVLAGATGLGVLAAEEQTPMTPRGERVRIRDAETGEKAREAAWERIRDIERTRARMSEQFQAEREKIRDLVVRHREARTEAEREQLRKELHGLLEEGFERRHSVLKERLDNLKDECSRIESRIRENLDRKDDIIERRLERLLETPSRRGKAAEEGAGGMARVREREQRN